MLKRGGVRLLTTGEIKLATELYEKCIRYNEVWIHHGSYLPFGLQNDNMAMAPMGEIWFEKNVYCDDYSLSPVDLQHFFMHEMMHVWQYQRGMNVLVRGLFSWAVSYQYALNKKSLYDYCMEQQASIVSDYWLLLKYGFKHYKKIINYKNYDEKQPESALIDEYKKVLKAFPLKENTL